MAQFDFLPDDAVLQLRELADALSLWQLLLLAIWFMLFILRQVCDRVLEAAFCWLVSSVRKSAKTSGNSFGAVVSNKTNFGSREVFEKDLCSVGTSGSSEIDKDEQNWQDYFADPLQWWDNHSNKQNPRAHDFKHRVSKKALWVDGWYTLKWVKDRLL